MEYGVLTGVDLLCFSRACMRLASLDGGSLFTLL